jgi:hypothetical protein
MPASADSSQKLNHDAIAMARFFSGLLGLALYAAQSCALTTSDILGPFYRFGAPLFS